MAISKSSADVGLGAEQAPSDAAPPAENLRTAYEKVCDCHTAMVEFRAKLLALLPLASGTGVFLLLTTEAMVEFIAVGMLGALFTVGLYIYEYRGVRFCRGLAAIGIDLEDALGLASARFKNEPDKENQWPRGHAVEWAARVIYGSTLVAWLFVAGLGVASI